MPYKIDPDSLKSPLTSFAGLPLVAEAFRAFGLDQVANRLLALKKRQRGYTEGQVIESFALLLAAGGECLDDFAKLRDEQGLPAMLGYLPPSPDAARRFLYAFHDEAIMAQRPLGAAAWIPPESGALTGLGLLNRDLIHRYVRHLPGKELKTATLDHDATVIESKKRETFHHYLGGRGYQPSFVVWHEADLVVADEFRDGNVPAGAFNLRLVQKAFENLPECVQERYFRADSACYDHEVLSYLRHAGIGFAISADVSESLRDHIRAIPEKDWEPLDEDREWAQVLFVPGSALFEPNSVSPDRYLAIRWKPRQLTLFETEGYRYGAVVTNLRWEATKLIRWHRRKAGTIEQVHHVLKNELGLGVLPCGRFGADAAWSRLNVLTYNLLTVVKRVALPKSLRTAHPKRLRFEIFRLAGVVIRHARSTVVKLGVATSRIAALIRARYQIAGLALGTPA